MGTSFDRRRKGNRALLLCVGLAALSWGGGPALGAPEEVVLAVPDGEYRLLFDSRRVAKTAAKDALLVSPEAETPGLDTILEDCNEKDPAYAPCGADPIDYPGFAQNAKINIDRAIEKYKKIKQASHGKELATVRAHVLRSGAFYIWLLNTRFEFYRTGQAHVLKKSFGDIDPSKKCSVAIDRIAETKSRAEAYRLARVDWHNCVNLMFTKAHGKYPREEWDRFLKKFAITEKLERKK